MRKLFVIIGLVIALPGWSQTALEKARSYYEEKKLDSAMFWIQQIEESAYSHISEKLKGDILFDQSNFEEAINAYYSSIQIAEVENIPDPVFMAECYLYISECHGILGHYSLALKVARKSLAFAKDYSDPTMVADSKFNMSVFFVRLGQYDSALTYMEQVFVMDLEEGDSSALAYDYNSMGFIMGQKEEYEKAIEYYQKSIDYLRPDQQRELALRISNMAMAELNLGRYALSESHFRESMSLYEVQGNEVKFNNQKVNLAVLYMRTGQYDVAHVLLNEALNHYINTNNVYSICRTRIHLAKLHIENGDKKQALIELERAKTISAQQQLLEEQIEILQLTSSLQFQLELFKNAYETLESLTTLKDSLDKNNQLNRIKDLEISLISQQKEQEIEKLNLEKKLAENEVRKARIQQFSIIALTVILLIGGTAIFILQRNRSRLAKDLMSKEIDDLRLRINAYINGRPSEFKLNQESINAKLELPLSDREFEILQLAISDKSNREIAESIFLSVNTVKFHLKRIYEKLGVSGRKEALQFVIKSPEK